MVDEFEEEEFVDDEETRGRSGGLLTGREEVLTLEQYGRLKITPYCRENYLLRAVRTRISDRDYEFIVGRGGDRFYVVVTTQRPKTQVVSFDIWVRGHELDLKELYDLITKEDEKREELETKYREEADRQDQEELNDDEIQRRIDGEILSLKERAVRRSFGLRIPQVVNENFAEYVEALVELRQENLPQGLTYVDLGGGKGTYYFDYGDNRVQKVSSFRQEAYFSLVDGRIWPDNTVVEEVSLALLTDELTDTALQDFRGPWNMVPKYQLNRRLSWYFRRRKESLDRRARGLEPIWVLYPRTGCSPKFERPLTEVGWRDTEYRKSILKNRRRGLPPGLRYNRDNGQYEVPVDYLDVDGLRVLAHLDVYRNYNTGQDYYEGFMSTLAHVGLRGSPAPLPLGEPRDPLEKAKAWVILSRYGEDGLRTASRVLLEEFDAANPRIEARSPAERERRTRARGRYEYDYLRRQMRFGVYHYYNRERPGYEGEDPPADFNPFWEKEDFETRFPDWVRLANNFVDEHFDRSFPSEQYRFKEEIDRDFGSHDHKDPESRAKALQRLVGRSVYVISPPTVDWHYVPPVDENSSGFWQPRVNWSTFDYFAQSVEALRDWIRMIREWQMSRAAENARAAMSFDDRTADSLRQNDWGGIWNPVVSKFDWTFWLLYLFAEKRAPMPEKPVQLPGASEEAQVAKIEAYSEALENRVAIMGWAWVDRHPDVRMPHDGALRVLTAQRWADWLQMMGLIRGFNSALGEGLIPRFDDYLKDVSVRVRNYSNETVWYESDEGALRDPMAVWGYLRGIIQEHVINILNYRLHGSFGSRFDRDNITTNYMDVRLDYDGVRLDKATRLRDEVHAMWQNAPLDGVKKRLMKIFDDAVRQNVVHVRPEYMRLVNGLPEEVVNKLQPVIRGLNRRSDRRVLLWAQNLSTGYNASTHGRTGAGRRGFTLGQWQTLVEQGFGTNTYRGMTSEEEQDAQNRLGLMAWKNGQYDKAIWLTRELVLMEFDKLVKDPVHMRKEIYSAVGNGLSIDVFYEMVDIFGRHEGGPLFDLRHIVPRREELEEAHPISEMDKRFHEMLVETGGKEELEAIINGLLFNEMRAGKDPYKGSYA